jgi:hypothetical protein
MHPGTELAEGDFLIFGLTRLETPKIPLCGRVYFLFARHHLRVEYSICQMRGRCNVEAQAWRLFVPVGTSALREAGQ